MHGINAFKACQGQYYEETDNDADLSFATDSFHI